MIRTLLLLITTILLSVAPAISLAQTVPRGKILYFHDNHRLLRVSRDGSATSVLTTILDPVFTMTLSPDGSQVLLNSSREGSLHLYRMNIDGTNLTRLPLEYPAMWTKWSPDGQRIAFISEQNGQDELYVMDADGTDVSRLTDSSSSKSYVAWSPDGQYLAFSAGEGFGANETLLVIDSEGSELRKLADDLAFLGGLAWSPDGTQIAYESRGEQGHEISVINADGSNPLRLTTNEHSDGDLSWSPDGTRIAFVSQMDAGAIADLYVINADGSDLRPLTENAADSDSETAYTAHVSSPIWSPDGEQIVFVFSSSEIPTQDLYMMDADGSNAVRLAQQVTSELLGWSADGQSLIVGNPFLGLNQLDLNAGNTVELFAHLGWPDLEAPILSLESQQVAFYAGGLDAGAAIYTMNLEGSDIIQLTSDPAPQGRGLDWSPDGEQIVYVSDQDGASGLYVMDANGANQTRLSDNEAWDFMPVWSPDGRQIVFVSAPDGDPDIYRMDVEGLSQVRLTKDEGLETNPVWSPNGQRIAFVSEREGQRDIYVMNTDRSNLIRLTHDRAVETALVWSPDGAWLAYYYGYDGPSPDYGIYVVRTDGSSSRPQPLVDGQVVFSFGLFLWLPD